MKYIINYYYYYYFALFLGGGALFFEIPQNHFYMGVAGLGFLSIRSLKNTDETRKNEHFFEKSF